MWYFLTRNFRVSKGKAFLWTVTWGGCGLLFGWMGFADIGIAFGVLAFIFACIFVSKTRRDLGYQTVRVDTAPHLIPSPAKTSSGSNSLKVPEQLSRES